MKWVFAQLWELQAPLPPAPYPPASYAYDCSFLTDTTFLFISGDSPNANTSERVWIAPQWMEFLQQVSNVYWYYIYA